MITDEERRNVAANIRSAAERAKDDLNDDSNYSKVAVAYVVSCGVRGVPHYKDLLHLADLIDRPTCHVVEHKTHYGSYGCEEAGELWVLSCGDECITDSDFPPNYCPECGAVVVNEN